MSYIESLNKDASGELSCSKDRCGSKVPHDVSHNEEGVDDLNDMKEGDGGWHKLPSQQWKLIQQSQSLSESGSFLVSLYLRTTKSRKCHEFLRAWGWDGSNHRSEHCRSTQYHKLRFITLQAPLRKVNENGYDQMQNPA